MDCGSNAETNKSAFGFVSWMSSPCMKRPRGAAAGPVGVSKAVLARKSACEDAQAEIEQIKRSDHAQHRKGCRGRGEQRGETAGDAEGKEPIADLDARDATHTRPHAMTRGL